MCKVKDCNAAVYLRNMCQSHYKKEWRKLGFTHNERLCSLNDCGKKHFAKGFCQSHYDMHRLHGDALYNYTREFHNGRKLHPAEYGVWAGIKSRCNNPRNKDYKNYGGRGISVCPRWNYSFVSFYQDMGDRPSDNHSIDRINNDGDYKPGNCRWATRTEQRNNQRRKSVSNKNQAN